MSEVPPVDLSQRVRWVGEGSKRCRETAVPLYKTILYSVLIFTISLVQSGCFNFIRMEKVKLPDGPKPIQRQEDGGIIIGTYRYLNPDLVEYFGENGCIDAKQKVSTLQSFNFWYPNSIFYGLLSLVPVTLALGAGSPNTVSLYFLPAVVWAVGTVTYFTMAATWYPEKEMEAFQSFNECLEEKQKVPLETKNNLAE